MTRRSLVLGYLILCGLGLARGQDWFEDPRVLEARKAAREGRSSLPLVPSQENSDSVPPTPAEIAQGFMIRNGEHIFFETDGVEPEASEPVSPEDQELAEELPENDCPEAELASAEKDKKWGPKDFRRAASRFFFIRFAPSPQGADAYRRVKGHLDRIWVEIDRRFPLHQRAQLKAYVYTTSGHYHARSGGMAWSGGFFDPRTNETHLPIPPCADDASVKALLIHEMTHYSLRVKTDNAIGKFRFVNEGIAQLMEMPHSEGYKRKLAFLKRLLDSGKELMDYGPMQYRVGSQVGWYYAQSWATLRYLQTTYGDRGVDQLIDAIAEDGGRGALDETFEKAFGFDTKALKTKVTRWIERQP